MSYYTGCACPNANCLLYAEENKGNIRHRSWTGRKKDIERLRCTECKKEFSIREGTLQEYAKITPEQQVLLLKCLRWRVPDEGAADIASVMPNTVRLFQQKAAKHAVTLHERRVQDIESSGVQVDEMHSKVSERWNYWLGAALCMSSLMIISVCFGSRDQCLANRLFADLTLRIKALKLLLTDGWRCYQNAFLLFFGKLYQPRRTAGKGRRMVKRLKLCGDVLFGQVVKIKDHALRLIGVEHRALSCSLKHLLEYINIYDLGSKVHTSHIERWFSSLRSAISAAGRRSKSKSKSCDSFKKKVWIFVGLYNWVLPHKSLCSNGKKDKTPAVVAGLIDTPLTYLEYIWLRTYPLVGFREAISQQISRKVTKERLEATKRYRWDVDRCKVFSNSEKPM